MDPVASFTEESNRSVAAMAASDHLRQLSHDWMVESGQHRYTYNFRWLGRPVIQFPQDLVAMQEIIWDLKPGVIIETGIAHGGSLVFYASMLELCGGDGIVVGIDIDIRTHNRIAIESHPMAKRIRMVEGSSIDPETVTKVRRLADGRSRAVVVLDSNHTHEHVLAELEAYSPLVNRGGYVVVFDTLIEDLPEIEFKDRPWAVGNNPKTAVQAFLERNDRFEVDKAIDAKLQISVAPSGYLRCVRDR